MDDAPGDFVSRQPSGFVAADFCVRNGSTTCQWTRVSFGFEAATAVMAGLNRKLPISLVLRTHPCSRDEKEND